jgi:hypothetical protein
MLLYGPKPPIVVHLLLWNDSMHHLEGTPHTVEHGIHGLFV